MSHKKNEFDVSIKLTKKAFFISGVEIGKSKYSNMVIFKWLYHFNFIWLHTDVFGEFSWLSQGIAMGKSLDELSLVAPCTTICILGTAKMMNMYFYRDVLESAVSKLRSLHPSNLKEGSFESQVVEKSKRFLRLIILFLISCSTVLVIIFSAMPLILMGYDYYNLGYTELKLAFLTNYFFDSIANVQIWSFVYFHQVWSSKYLKNFLNLFCTSKCSKFSF